MIFLLSVCPVQYWDIHYKIIHCFFLAIQIYLHGLYFHFQILATPSRKRKRKEDKVHWYLQMTRRLINNEIY